MLYWFSTVYPKIRPYFLIKFEDTESDLELLIFHYISRWQPLNNPDQVLDSKDSGTNISKLSTYIGKLKKKKKVVIKNGEVDMNKT